MKTKHLVLAMALIALSRVSATSVVPPTFEQLVGQAEFIFQGTVTNVRSIWEGEGADRHIDTYITFQVQDNVKGDAGSSYTIRVLGGTVGDETMEVTDTPKFKLGDTDILFVEHNNEQFVPLVGINHGRFHVQRDDETGRDIVVNGEGAPVKDLAKLGREDESVSAAEGISAGDFKSAIKKQLADANQSAQ